MKIQQGDVLIRACPIPYEARTAATHVLAEGEATGHAHVASAACEVLAVADRTYLRVPHGGGHVTHEEHRMVTLPPGEYVVGRVREYDHFAEDEDDAIHDVLD